jgi:NAD(P)-dependent dehydrogenase (short-subunit alcohol dehydrogenase family)
VRARFDASGLRLLVVGASSGLGREIGLAASRAGARVAFAARRSERLEEIVAGAPNPALAIKCDVREERDCEHAIDQTVGTLGGLDALVYASGISALGDVHEADAATWRAILETNLVGAALIAGRAIPHLRASGGRALFLSSYGIRQHVPGMGLYCISKVALDALIDTLRAEHPDVQFTRIVVGSTEGTEFAARWDPELVSSYAQIMKQRGTFTSSTWMPIGNLAEAVLAVLCLKGYVDDLSILPRPTDPAAPNLGD